MSKYPVTTHSVTKRSGETITFFVDWDYSNDKITEKLLKQALNGDCGDFLQSSASFAMNIWCSGSQTGNQWALKVASDVSAHLKERITLRNTYKLFTGEDRIVCTEVNADTTILRLSWDKTRSWVWVKRLLPIRDTNGKLESTTFGAIWEDGIYRQLSRNKMYDIERRSLKAFNMRPKQQWVDKRGFVTIDHKKLDSSDDERMAFASIEEAERWERNRRATEYTANNQVNMAYAHPE